MSNQESHKEEDEEFLSFLDEENNQETSAHNLSAPPWQILVVDDDIDVHKSTEYALQNVRILERPLRFLHANSSTEAIDLLRIETDIAVILLDVVMESEDAGLVAVDIIRNQLGLTSPRIILRTGQPGYAPEIETIRRYDINDYKTKSELTRVKLYTALTAAIRSYDQLCRLDAGRKGLEHIIRASNQFISELGVHAFASGVIRQIAAFIGVDPEGLVCAQDDGHGATSNCTVIAASGAFSELNGHRLIEISNQRIVKSLLQCFTEQKNQIGPHQVTLFFPGHNAHNFAAFIDTPHPLCPIDQHMLEVFCANISICGDNVSLVEELRILAYHDAPLKLPNRSYFVEAVDAQIASMKKGVDLNMALLDVDKFAEINDIFGHLYGDHLLFAIARRLEDAFGKDCILARVGNDTFGLFGESDLVNPESLASFFNANYDIEGVERPVSMSIGFVKVAAQSCEKTESALLLKDVSIAVKRAKENGQGQFAWYSPEIARAMRERTLLLNDLRYAFKHEMLHVAYQPQVELATGKTTGVEALMRWRTADGRFIPPDTFIPIAEHSGLIISLGGWILRKALQAVRQLEDAGFPGIRMSVNVSTNQFRQPDFVQLVDQALIDCNVAPQSLELEITESVAAMGLPFVEATLLALRQRNISVAIDDFGTGYSSLSYLGRLSANRLKIDRSFILALTEKGSGAKIPEMVIRLGRQLNMKVIAEGVETEEQLELLRKMDCDEIQGYLFARPMPFEELLSWLEERRQGEKA